MSLTILDDVITEETRSPTVYASSTNVVSSATYALSPVSSAISSALSTMGVSAYSGTGHITQYAEKTNFVSSTNQVSDYFLGDSSGNALVGVATNIYVGANEVFLYSTGDPNIVVGLIGSGTTASATGAVAFSIALDETKSGAGLVTNANLWINLYAPLVESGLNAEGTSDTLNLSGLIYLGSNYNTATEVPFTDFSKVPSGNNTFDVIFPTGVNADLQLLVTGVSGTTEKNVTVSTQGIGAGSQSVTTGTSIRIDTVAGVVQTTVDSNSECVPANLAYTHHVDIDAASFQITQTNPTHHLVDINLTALTVSGDPQHQSFIDNALANEGGVVHISAADVHIFSGTTDITATFGGTITQVGDTVTITNLAKGMTVKFNTEGVHFDRMLIGNVDSSDTFDVGNILVTTVTGGSNTEFANLGGHAIFQDDGPVISTTGATVPTLTVYDADLSTNPHTSFTGLFTAPDYGADSAGTETFKLGVKGDAANVVSGLFDTATGQSIVLNYDPGTKTVIGSTVTSHDTVFVISVSASGEVTLDQRRAIQHPNTSSSTETVSLASDLVTLTATLADSEASSHNDSASATVNIGSAFVFTDDGPTMTPQAAGSLTPNDLILGNTTVGGTHTDSSSYGLAPGGDGLGS